MDADVIVVGAGPSGLMMGHELALGGAKAIVLERRTAPVGSRAGNILPRVLELLDARGLAQAFIERAATIRKNPLIPRHTWAGMEPVEMRHLDSRFRYRLILPQNHTEDLLAASVEAQGVPIVRGAAVHGFEQDDDGVVVRVRTAAGDERALTARYLVGADGSRSAVRQSAGIEYVGHDGTFTGIVADARLQFPWPNERRMANNERGWVTAYPFGPAGRITRFVMVHAARRSAARDEPVTATEVRQCAREILEEPELAFDELEWGSRYTDEMRLATRFRDRRVILVGESVRIHYPASGVGMNFCLQDAFNVGWKLAMVVKGHARPEILDTYELERRPVVEALVESIAAQCAVQFDFSPEGVAFKRMFERDLLPLPEVNRQLALDLNALARPYPSVDGSHPLTGSIVPDAMVQTRDGVSRIGVLLRGQEFLLVDCAGEDRYAGLELGSVPVRVVSGAPLPVPERLAGVRGMLVRPDGYVAWADSGPADPARAVQEIGRWLELRR